MTRLLIIEDEPKLASFLVRALTAAGCGVEWPATVAVPRLPQTVSSMPSQHPCLPLSTITRERWSPLPDP